MTKSIKTEIGRNDLKLLLTNLEEKSPYSGGLVFPLTEDDMMYDIIGIAINEVEVIECLAIVTYNPISNKEIILAYFNDDEEVWHIMT